MIYRNLRSPSSNPSAFAVLYIKDYSLNKFVKFARTVREFLDIFLWYLYIIRFVNAKDPIKDNCDPDWIVGITIDYLFEVIQEVILF